MAATLSEWLNFLEELNGASVFTIVILCIGVISFIMWTLLKKFQAHAKKCGVQKALLVGHVQKVYDLEPGDAILKTNDMVAEALRRDS